MTSRQEKTEDATMRRIGKTIQIYEKKIAKCRENMDRLDAKYRELAEKAKARYRDEIDELLGVIDAWNTVMSARTTTDGEPDGPVDVQEAQAESSDGGFMDTFDADAWS